MATAPTFDEAIKQSDAVNLLEELLPAQTHSYLLGLKLGLPVYTVDSICSTYQHPRDRLLHVLIAFLNQETPRPTWTLVVEALRSPAVDLPLLARKVVTAHFPNPTATREVDDAAVTTTAKTIVDATTNVDNSANTNTENISDSATREKENTSANIGVPGIVYLTTNASSSGGECMKKTLPRPESPIPTPMTGQYVQMKIKQFERRFNGLKRAARTSLERINVSVKQVADALMDLPADDMEEHKQFLESHLSILYQAHDQSELFGALGFNMNYLSYQLLEYLIFEFELEVAEEMEVYKADLRRFRERTSLLLFCQTQKKRYVEPPSRFQEVVGKFKWPRDVTLEVVEQFRQEYAFHYNLRECAMMLVEVRPGSFIVAWFVPESIVEKLKMKIPEKILEKFATAELTIGGDCIYSSEDAELEADVYVACNEDDIPDEATTSGVVSVMQKVSLSTESDDTDGESSSDEEYLTEDDFLFVDKRAHDFFCPVTTDLLLKPHLTSCCGTHISEEATTRIKLEGKACPMCNSSNWHTMLDKHFQRQVTGLKMFCCHQDRGCVWVGELSQLQHHVRSCQMKKEPLQVSIQPTDDGSPNGSMPDLQRSHETDPGLHDALTEFVQRAKAMERFIPKHHIKLGALVGHGETGLVYSGYINDELYAIKTSKALSADESRKQLVKEGLAMLSFNHPNVMPLVGMALDGEKPLIIMPFMMQGTLLQYVRKNKSDLFETESSNFEKIEVARKLCLSMCHQIVKGMAHIAEKLFVHCDLAARNCLIGGDGVVKVSDFGLAAKLNPGHNQYLRPPGGSARVPIKWMAPESIEHRGLFSEKTDVWSFGVTCWEVFTCGAMPYDGVPPVAVMREVLDGNRLERPSNLVCSDQIWSVITDCWQEDHEKRPNFVSLVDSLFNLMDSDPTYIMLH